MKKTLFTKILVCVVLLLLCACGPKNETAVNVLIEQGEYYTVSDPLVSLQPGETASFYVRTDPDYAVVAADYVGNYTLTRTRGMTKLVLEDVRRPARIRLTLSRDFRTIRYEANGGQPVTGIDRSVSVTYSVRDHLRPNVSIGTDLFTRDGYTLACWNTEADGSGLRVGLGSRVTADEELTLYAQWVPWTPSDRFTWSLDEDGGARVTSCTETGAQLVVPEILDGHPVTTLAKNALALCPAQVVILPKSLVRIETGAFSGAKLRELWFYDNLESFADDCFTGCEELSTLRINAIEDPYGYAFRRESVWVDKLDVLIKTMGQKRMIFYGGCSMWYNLDAATVQAAFGDRWQILNMGINGLASSLLQMEIMRCFVTEHDVLIHTPEIASEQQLLLDTGLHKMDDRLWAALEYNYDLVSLVDIRVFEGGVFDSLKMYWDRKEPGGSYNDVYLDSKGRAYFDMTGCIPFLREVSTETLTDQVRLDPVYLQDLSRLEREYELFTRKGVPVYVSFACVDIDQVPAEQQGNTEMMDRLFRERFTRMDGVKVFGRLEDHIYHDRDFFDTVYHLLSVPAARCTQTWIRDLTPLLAEDGLLEEGGSESLQQQ